MPKHFKFKFQEEIVNAKQLANKLGVSYPKLFRLIKAYECKTTEDVIAALKAKEKFHVGDKYGKYTIISNETKIYNTHLLVKVKCDCGKETEKLLSDLKTGNIIGCANCMARERSLKVHIGDVYKHWKVIEGPRVSKCGCIEYKVLCLKCNNSTRWIQPNELKTEKMCFMCHKCAQKERGIRDRINNGGTKYLSINRYNRLKNAAAKRNYEFSVSLEYLSNLYLKQDKKCAITGDTLSDIKFASLDRINSSLGYIEGNVQWVTIQANLSKHVMTMNELYEFCKKVLNHANQQPSQPLTKLEGSETNT